MATERVRLDGAEVKDPPSLRHLLPPDHYEVSSSFASRLHDLTYITAEREGPREIYTLEDRQAARVVGPRGRAHAQCSIPAPRRAGAPLPHPARCRRR